MWAMAYDAPGNGVYVPALLKELSEAAGDRAIFTCDVGQHQMWVAQHCRFTRPQAHLTSAGLGTMGYGLPAGIGALPADTEASVNTVLGDGQIMKNRSEEKRSELQSIMSSSYAHFCVRKKNTMQYTN